MYVLPLPSTAIELPVSLSIPPAFFAHPLVATTGVTVSVALLLVTLPALLVTTTLNTSPLLALLVGSVV